MPPGAVLDLSPGAVVVLDGRQWTVQRREPHLGQVLLAAPDGTRQQVTFQFLVTHPRCFTSSRSAALGAGRGRQEASPEDLPPGRQELAVLRMAHLLEVRTGFRSGSREHPGQGEPRPEYDPDATTLTQRRHAKVAELAALDPQQARLLGLDRVGYRTLIRWEAGRLTGGWSAAPMTGGCGSPAGIPVSPSRSGRPCWRSGRKRCTARGYRCAPGTSWSASTCARRWAARRRFPATGRYAGSGRSGSGRAERASATRARPTCR